MAAMLLSTAIALGAPLTISDLHDHYATIFPTQNRNAASHRWASYILERSSQLSAAELTNLFSGFCLVSGSPVNPTEANRYHYSLSYRGSSPGKANGFIHHCCSPCVCDTLDLIKADTKSLVLANGETQTFTFATIGDPCRHAALLRASFTDPFSGEVTSLASAAPEVTCDAGGKLNGATFSDHGGVIIGLLAPAPALAPLASGVAPDPERAMSVDGVAGVFRDSRDFTTYCADRASSGFNSGMGLIFRRVAQISSDVPRPSAPASAPASSAPSSCARLLPAADIAAIERMIATEPVLVFGMKHTRCLAAASERLEAAGACFRWESWEVAEAPLWAYMKCLHPNELVGGMEMHSYVYFGGEYIGNGFALMESTMAEASLMSKLHAANAKLDCAQSCDLLAPAEERAEFSRMTSAPLALLGWSGCPCTNIARSRFESAGACYLQKIWPTDTAPMYKWLQCKYGKHHHSFVFAAGRFLGDGFELEENRMGSAAFRQVLDGAQASLHCQRQGDENLNHHRLKPCTQATDGSTTGWTRTGSCNWDPADTGYHEVCVTMSDQFLEQSASRDANDLRSVVQAGGHWCICAWAWAAAVQRDPTNYEGITLDCERTNAKLREVYESFISAGADLTSPSGAAYKAKTALDAVNRVCAASNGRNATIDKVSAAAIGAATATVAGALAVPNPKDASAPHPVPAAGSAVTSDQAKAAAGVDAKPSTWATLVLIALALMASVGILAIFGRRPRCVRNHPSAALEAVHLTHPSAQRESTGGLGGVEAEADLEVSTKLGAYDSAAASDEELASSVQMTPSTKSAFVAEARDKAH